MIYNIFPRVRAIALSLAVGTVLALPLCLASQASAQAVVSGESSPYTVASDAKPDALLAQAAPAKPVKGGKPNKAEKQAAEPDEETAKVQEFLSEKVKWLRELPVLKTLFQVMPQLWTPIRAAILLAFLAFFIVFYILRQKRNQLEFEQNRQPSAAEVEFGIVAGASDSDGKEASP